MNRRLALVAALALFVGAALFTAIPASADGAECGWWMNREYGKSESQKIAQDSLDNAQEASEITGGEDLASESTGLAIRVATAYRDCTNTLNTRRNVSIGLLIAAGLVPAAILYVAGRKED